MEKNILQLRKKVPMISIKTLIFSIVASEGFCIRK